MPLTVGCSRNVTHFRTDSTNSRRPLCLGLESLKVDEKQSKEDHNCPRKHFCHCSIVRFMKRFKARLCCVDTSCVKSVIFYMDEDLLLAALGADDREAMLALFTNPILAIRYRFSAKIPIDDPVLHHKPPLSCAAAYFGAIHCIEGLAENNDKFLNKDETSMSVMDFAVIGNHLGIVKYLAEVGIGFEESMLLAAEYGRTEILSYAVQELKVNAMLTGDDRQTILHRSAERGRLDTVKFIASEVPDFDVNFGDKDGNTALHLAVLSSRLNVVKYLLTVPSANKNPANAKRETLLHMAAKKEKPDILSAILAANGVGMEKQWDFMTMDYMELDDDMDAQPLERVAQTMDVNETNEEGLTPLLVAAGDGGIAVVEALLSVDGINIDAQTKEGLTALHVAMARKRLGVFERLCNAGANVNVRDGHGRTPLMCACLDGLVEFVACLLKQPSVDVNAKEGATSCMHVIAKSGDVEIAKLLLERDDIELNEVNDENLTPVMIALREGHEELLHLLLARPDVDRRGVDLERLTALHKAARFNQVDVVKSLLEADGLLINFKDAEGFTALHVATRNGHEEIVALLLKHPRTDVNARDDRGKTPLYFAMNQNIRDLLHTHGCV